MDNKYLERKNRCIKTEVQIDISINILFILKEIRETSQYTFGIWKIILIKYNIVELAGHCRRLISCKCLI